MVYDCLVGKEQNLSYSFVYLTSLEKYLIVTMIRYRRLQTVTFLADMIKATPHSLYVFCFSLS